MSSHDISALLSSLSDHLSSSLAQNLFQNRIPAPKPQKDTKGTILNFEGFVTANLQ
jgi:hypothetical protein